MKRISFLLAILAASAISLPAASLTDSDRRQLLDHLYKTRQLLVETLTGLTPAQLKFQPADDRWSILQCAEHLVEAEPFLMARVENKSADPSQKKSGATDQQVLKGWGTVQNKVKAPPALTPTGKYADADAVLKEFDRRRAKSIEFVASTDEDLRARICCGGMEVYQQILGMSAHVTRHVTQMNDVKADPKFPK